MSTAPDSAWRYPIHIAHRGAGKLAPENTRAAFRARSTWRARRVLDEYQRSLLRGSLRSPLARPKGGAVPERSRRGRPLRTAGVRGGSAPPWPRSGLGGVPREARSGPQARAVASVLGWGGRGRSAHGL